MRLMLNRLINFNLSLNWHKFNSPSDCLWFIKYRKKWYFSFAQLENKLSKSEFRYAYLSYKKGCSDSLFI